MTFLVTIQKTVTWQTLLAVDAENQPQAEAKAWIAAETAPSDDDFWGPPDSVEDSCLSADQVSEEVPL
jgi:hypothetical protein